ncbi:MAG: hypothetical protein MUE41_06755, partial [Gemmatimonadaceae bacterium]|nr:hypothetical protein [Gemmatimonadaceae bacterium]
MASVPPSPADVRDLDLPVAAEPPRRTTVRTTELKRLPFTELARRADTLGVANEPGLGTPELIHRIELAMLRQRDILVTEGVLDIEKGGHGFIR